MGAAGEGARVPGVSGVHQRVVDAHTHRVLREALHQRGVFFAGDEVDLQARLLQQGFEPEQGHRLVAAEYRPVIVKEERHAAVSLTERRAGVDAGCRRADIRPPERAQGD